MNGRSLVGAACVAALSALALAAPGSATAKPAKITGKLSAPGYTVIALAANGKATTDRAPQGKFKLRPPTKKFTLHLRAKDGRYGGPITIGKKKQGKKAIVGVNAGAKLGKIEVKSAKGYAKTTKEPAKKWIDTERTARAKRGIPIGAGKAGLVRSKKTKGGIPGDLDVDGIPDPLDIDDDGDLILDDYDRPPKNQKRARGERARGARSSRVVSKSPDGGPVDFQLVTSLGGVGVRDGWAVNVNGVNGGSTDEEIAAQNQRLGALDVLWSGLDRKSGELNCGALVYCSAGGTGRWMPSNIDPSDPRESSSPLFDYVDSEGVTRPGCCDADDDGLASLSATLSFGDGTDLMVDLPRREPRPDPSWRCPDRAGDGQPGGTGSHRHRRVRLCHPSRGRRL